MLQPAVGAVAFYYSLCAWEGLMVEEALVQCAVSDPTCPTVVHLKRDLGRCVDLRLPSECFGPQPKSEPWAVVAHEG